MSILHRIFVSKHKRRKIPIRRKIAYKKFTGLKTFKNMLYTKFSVISIKPMVNKRRVTKKIRRKSPIRIVFPRFNNLAAKEKRQEALLAQNDVAKFKTLLLDTDNQTHDAPEEPFQAFVPQAKWNKMTSDERRAHIKKRKLLAVKRHSKVLTASRYSFCSKNIRPALQQMSFARRRQYLKNLIKVAKADNDVVQLLPLTRERENKIHLHILKSTIIAATKRRVASKRVYKNITYTSLMPAGINRLIP